MTPQRLGSSPRRPSFAAGCCTSASAAATAARFRCSGCRRLCPASVSAMSVAARAPAASRVRAECLASSNRTSRLGVARQQYQPETVPRDWLDLSASVLGCQRGSKAGPRRTTTHRGPIRRASSAATSLEATGTTATSRDLGGEANCGRAQHACRRSSASATLPSCRCSTSSASAARPRTSHARSRRRTRSRTATSSRPLQGKAMTAGVRLRGPDLVQRALLLRRVEHAPARRQGAPHRAVHRLGHQGRRHVVRGRGRNHAGGGRGMPASVATQGPSCRLEFF